MPENLQTLKEQTSDVVARIQEHPNISSSTKIAFQDALRKLESGDTTSFSLIAQMGLPIAPICQGCASLNAELKRISKELEQYKAEIRTYKEGAVRRQIALNIESEIKYMTIQAREDLAYLLSFESLDEETEDYAKGQIQLERYMSRTDIYDLIKELSPTQQQFICLTFHQTCSLFSFINTILYNMKAFSDADAHPTTLEGKPVTFEIAKELASTTIKRTKPTRARKQGVQPISKSTVDDTEAIKIKAEAAVLGLWEIRKTQGYEKEDGILVNFSSN